MVERWFDKNGKWTKVELEKITTSLNIIANNIWQNQIHKLDISLSENL